MVISPDTSTSQAILGEDRENSSWHKTPGNYNMLSTLVFWTNFHSVKPQGMCASLIICLLHITAESRILPPRRPQLRTLQSTGATGNGVYRHRLRFRVYVTRANGLGVWFSLRIIENNAWERSGVQFPVCPVSFSPFFLFFLSRLIVYIYTLLEILRSIIPFESSFCSSLFLDLRYCVGCGQSLLCVRLW